MMEQNDTIEGLSFLSSNIEDEPDELPRMEEVIRGLWANTTTKKLSLDSIRLEMSGICALQELLSQNSALTDLSI